MSNSTINNIKKNLDKLASIPPIPHAPNWRYLCPHCFAFWEQEHKESSYIQVCSKCVLKMIGSNT